MIVGSLAGERLADRNEFRRGSSLIHQVLMMNPKHYYHTPIKPESTRASCPVCHQAVYSRAGIHPQCAVIQHDPPKSKSKKPQEAGHLELAIEPADQAVATVLAEAPLVKPASPTGQPIRPSVAKIAGVTPARLGSSKGTSNRFTR